MFAFFYLLSSLYSFTFVDRLAPAIVRQRKNNEKTCFTTTTTLSFTAALGRSLGSSSSYTLVAPFVHDTFLLLARALTINLCKPDALSSLRSLNSCHIVIANCNIAMAVIIFPL